MASNRGHQFSGAGIDNIIIVPPTMTSEYEQDDSPLHPQQAQLSRSAVTLPARSMLQYPSVACEQESFEWQTCLRASTAPSRPLTSIEEFKISRKYLQLEQAILACNLLSHHRFDRIDLEGEQNKEACQKYLSCLEELFQTFKVPKASRDYRQGFSHAYKALYKEGQPQYLVEILENAQQALPHLWVNGEKYPFSAEVLELGHALIGEFMKLQHTLRDAYGKVNQQLSTVCISQLCNQIYEGLRQLDNYWAYFQKRYLTELMSIEVQARSLVCKAIELEKCLTSVEVRERMKGKVLLNSEQFLSTRQQLCELLSQINQVANHIGQGRDDLDHFILCETEGVLRRISRNQSKAIRILGERIRGSFLQFRQLLRKYEKNIEMVDPQLKHNRDLVKVLADYQKSWQKGALYICDAEKRRYLLHFSGTIEAVCEKHEDFQGRVECMSEQLFLMIPELVILKSLDKDDRNLCKYFLPALNQIDTKTFRMYFELQKIFDEWKRSALAHYSYYNCLQKLLLKVRLTNEEQKIVYANQALIGRIVSRIKNLGYELQRYNPSEWNAFMEICLAGQLAD